MSDRRSTILVVKDDRSTRQALLDLLSAEGYRAVGAENGRQALDVLAEMDAPSLILLDLMMPVMDGWQFLAARPSEQARPRTPVVLLSGMHFIGDATGVADFLPKPIDLSMLRACVRRFCGNGPASTSEGD